MIKILLGLVLLAALTEATAQPSASESPEATPTTQEVELWGEMTYEEMNEDQMEDFLIECTAALDTVTCTSVSAGSEADCSITVVIESDSSLAVSSAVDDITTNNLQLATLGTYEVYDDQCAEVPGCTDSEATNFDSSATADDGSCEYPVVLGCTDTDADNYNAEANEDDESCTYYTDAWTDIDTITLKPDSTSSSPGSTYDEIMDFQTKEAFLVVCTEQLQEIYDNEDNDVECIDVTENAQVTSMIDLTLGSNNGPSMVSAVTGQITSDGFDILAYGDYVVFEDDVTFTITYVNDYDTWKGSKSDSEMDLFASFCGVSIATALGEDDSEYECSDPVADADTDQVMITYTVPSSQQSQVMGIVSAPNFTVLGFDPLAAVADASTCEKVDQADVVIWFNNNPEELFKPTNMEEGYPTGECFDEMTTAAAYEDRTLIDDLVAWNLQTVITVFASGSEQTNEMVDYVKGLGYVNVLNAESKAAVASARAGDGCNCFFQQEGEMEVVELDSYDVEISGLIVGVVGVILFFLLCVVCVMNRDSWFSDAEEVEKIMAQQEDILDRIRKKEDAATSEKVLPSWQGGEYTPGREYFSKEDVKVVARLEKGNDKSMMAALETEELV